MRLKADYLGGLRQAPTARPVSVGMLLTESGLSFDVSGQGDIIDIAWKDVEQLQVSGPSLSSDTGPSALGVALFGVIGLAMRNTRYQAVLLGRLRNGDEFGFAVPDYAPVGLRGALASVVPAELFDPVPETKPRVRWEYRTAGLVELDGLGADGWEAVGVYSDQGVVTVLLKRQTS